MSYRLHSMGMLCKAKNTRHTRLCEIVGIVAGSSGTSLHTLISGGICIVEDGGLPRTFYMTIEVRITQALSKGTQ